jgi:hypothetical protein
MQLFQILGFGRHIPINEAPPPGPVKRPPRLPRGIGSGYRRDPKVAAAALKSSAYQCAADATHQSFIARKTKMNFVEAHHPLLHQARDEGLKSRGLEIRPNDLVALYKGKLEDE